MSTVNWIDDIAEVFMFRIINTSAYDVKGSNSRQPAN